MRKKFKKLFITFILIINLSIFIIIIFNKKVMPIYLNYAESEMEKVTTTIINKSVSSCISDEFKDNLFIKNKLDSNTIVVDYDPVVLNKTISKISDLVYNNLKKIEEKDFSILKKYNLSENVFYIPSGIIFDSVLLNNLGPRIPVNMEMMGMVNPNIETKVSEYGINNSLIEVSIRVNVNIKMFLPTASKKISVNVIIPVSISIIQGNIPEYYFGNLKKSS